MPSLILAWKRLFDRPAGSSSTQADGIRIWQKTVMEEQESLREELESLLRMYVRTVDRFVERAGALTSEQFVQEQAAVESIRTVLQNALRRLEVSCKDQRELLDEWHEWVAFRRAVGQRQELEAAHQLRVEMIRSELTVRGIHVEDPAKREPPTRQAEPLQRAQEEAQSTPAFPSTSYRPQPVLDDLADWVEIRRTQIEPEWHAAENAWQELAAEAHVHPVHAVAALKRLKEAHADLRLLDRARHERRYRVAIFS